MNHLLTYLQVYGSYLLIYFPNSLSSFKSYIILVIYYIIIEATDCVDRDRWRRRRWLQWSARRQQPRWQRRPPSTPLHTPTMTA